jgi:hypothetical protein
MWQKLLSQNGPQKRVRKGERHMKIGCPKEIKPQEFRVGMTPNAAREAIAHGHEVMPITSPPGPRSSARQKSCLPRPT